MTARAWQRMLSGRRLNLLEPSPLDIEIEDIAHGLSFLTRWNGQTTGSHGYSVAEHSLLVEKIFNILYPKATPKWRMAALLHDSAEYVIGDLISPVKNTIGNGYTLLEEKLLASIYQRFGIIGQMPQNIKRKIKSADKHSAWLEAIQIADFTIFEANKFFGAPTTARIKTIKVVPKAPLKAKLLFLTKHAELTKLM